MNFSAYQLEQLKIYFGKIKSVDPLQPGYKGIAALLDSQSQSRLKQLADAKIKFLSKLATNRLTRENPSTGIRIVHNRLLGGWYVVRGPHQTPLNGRFDSKAEAQAWLANGPARRNPRRRTKSRAVPLRYSKMFAAHAAAIGAKVKRPPRKTLKHPHRTVMSKLKPIFCIQLRGVKTGKVYARMLAAKTPMSDLKAMARAIVNRHHEAVSAHRVAIVK